MSRRIFALLLVSMVSADSGCGTTPIAPNLYVGNAIIGGGQATAYTWPWTVAICTYDWFGNCNFQCAGSVIGNQWILTSASYVSGSTKAKDYRVQAGVFDESNKKEPYEQVMEVLSISIHPSYDGNHNDIALLQLKSPLTFNQFVQPVCLPSYDNNQVQPGQTAWFTGWGYTTDYQFGSPTKQLQQANMVIDPLDVCSSFYKDSIWTSQICAGTPSKTTCNYDLGGPLVQQPTYNGTWFQYGISSYRAKSCDAASVFTRVSSYCDFISQVSGIKCR